LHYASRSASTRPAVRDARLLALYDEKVRNAIERASRLREMLAAEPDEDERARIMKQYGRLDAQEALNREKARRMRKAPARSGRNLGS
jgi:hypothetical protein